MAAGIGFETALTRLLSMRDCLNLHHLSRLQRRESLARNFRLVERLVQRHDRRVDRLIGQLERSVMMRQRLFARRNRPAPCTASDGFMC